MNIISLKKHSPKSLLPLRFMLCLNALLIASIVIVSQPHAFAASTQERPIILKAAPGTKLDKIARTLNADLLKDDALHHNNSVVLVGTHALSPHKKNKALFVQIQSARLCGAAGCTTSIYLKKNDNWVTILDSVNGNISLLPSKHHDFYDILIGHGDTWIWNGRNYEDTAQ